MTIKPLWKLTLLALGASVGLLRSEANPAGQVERALAHWAFDEGAGQSVFVSDAQSGGVTGPGLDLGTRDWTVSVRVKTTAAGMLVTKMGFFGGANPDGWGVSISRNGTVGAHLRKSGAGEVNIFRGDGKTVNDGQWHHLAVVFDRTGNLVRYVDGSPSGAQYGISSLGGQSIDNANQVRMGARDEPGHEFFFRA